MNIFFMHEGLDEIDKSLFSWFKWNRMERQKKVNGKKWRCEKCVFVPMESSCNVANDFDKEPRLCKA
jgi:hypothetical protein